MLIKRSSQSNLTYIAEYRSGRLEHKMDHLVRIVTQLSFTLSFDSQSKILGNSKCSNHSLESC